MKKVLIFSAPSGSGKTTIVRHLLAQFPTLTFSVSATSRAPRGDEQEGVDYYFVTPDTFREKITRNEFLEWEEVYTGHFYGTPNDEAERAWAKGQILVCDVDVKGGLRIKEKLGAQALSVFIQPPSMDALRERLQRRSTDSPEAIARRLQKAAEELACAPLFDKIIVNRHLHEALNEAEKIVRAFVTSKPH
ncbi:MAG: guanylate kinase [Prevotellaceae bacterium]|jgi:guanylate kinase|nr:guanylate kinase [Prevotellaceae bacterium]